MAEKVDFTGLRLGSVPSTMLMTLYLHAEESRLPNSVLADHAAADVIDRIDYDLARLRRYSQPWGGQFVVTLRAKKLDVWTAAFLARHPDAVVLHLGCGLDSRVFRLDVPAGVDWYDVDVPEVMVGRRKLYEERPRYRMIGSSVTDPGWLEEIPAGRPVLVVAEGLLPYLLEADVRGLLQRITDRFARGGELLFDGVPRWTPTVTRFFRSGIGDGSELEAWNPRLRLVDRVSALHEWAMIPLRPQRVAFRVLAALPLSRDYVRLFRYEIREA